MKEKDFGKRIGSLLLQQAWCALLSSNTCMQNWEINVLKRKNKLKVGNIDAVGADGTLPGGWRVWKVTYASTMLTGPDLERGWARIVRCNQVHRGLEDGLAVRCLRLL